MIQDINPYKLDNHYENLPPEKDSYIAVVKGQTVLLKEVESANWDSKFPSVKFPTFTELEDMAEDMEIDKLQSSLTYLFTIDRRFFLIRDDTEYSKILIASIEAYLLEKGFKYIGLQELREKGPAHLRFAAVTACQIASWYSEHKFCGKCGGKMEHDSKERMMYCKKCNLCEYPKLCPAVIVAVTNGDDLLLTKYANFRKNYYALIGGYAEVGETIEETVKREVMEEVGLKVKNIKYYKSQPWPLTSTLLFGFFCEVDGPTDIHIDRNELSLAEWVNRKDLPEDTRKVSLTFDMITQFSGGNR